MISPTTRSTSALLAFPNRPTRLQAPHTECCLSFLRDAHALLQSFCRSVLHVRQDTSNQLSDALGCARDHPCSVDFVMDLPMASRANITYPTATGAM